MLKIPKHNGFANQLPEDDGNHRGCIVAESVEHADPVHKISIISRGIAALGYTQQKPPEVHVLIADAGILPERPVML